MRTLHLVISLLALLAGSAVGCSRSEPAPAAPPTPSSQGLPQRTPNESVDERRDLPSSTRTEALSLDEAVAALESAESQLGDSLALAGPNCNGARGLLEQICKLAARICELAESDTSSRESGTRCESATASCDGARRRVAARCP